MVCTTLTVTAAVPVLALSEKSFAHSDCTDLSACTKTIIEMGAANYVSFKVKGVVTVANAKFKLKFDWKLDGVSQSVTTANITQDIGTVTHCVNASYLWVAGDYTALTIVAIDLVAA